MVRTLLPHNARFMKAPRAPAVGDPVRLHPSTDAHARLAPGLVKPFPALLIAALVLGGLHGRGRAHAERTAPRATAPAHHRACGPPRADSAPT